MKQILLTLAITIVGQLNCLATMQKSDFIIWNNDTLLLNKSPLEELPQVCEQIREKEKFVSSGCWNGFVAEWRLVDSILYLKNIYSHSTGKSINKRLEKILNKKFDNGVIKAEWFTGEIFGGFGEYLHCLYFLVHTKERKFTFQNGCLKDIAFFDAQNIEYSIDEKMVEEYMYLNFDWSKFESSQEFYKSSSLFIEADNSGDLKTIKIESSAGHEIDKEIKRVLRLIPNWGIYYSNGEMFNFFNEYHFTFNNEKMKKYAH